MHLRNVKGALADFQKSKMLYLNTDILADTNRAEALRYLASRSEAANSLNPNVKSAEVEDLRQGLGAVEERARSELGLIKENEEFYQVVPAEIRAADDP